MPANNTTHEVCRVEQLVRIRNMFDIIGPFVYFGL